MATRKRPTAKRRAGKPAPLRLDVLTPPPAVRAAAVLLGHVRTPRPEEGASRLSRPTPPVFVKPIAPGQWLVVMGSAPVRTFPTCREAMEEARSIHRELLRIWSERRKPDERDHKPLHHPG